MSQKLLAGGLSLARVSSVLVFFGPDSQASLLPFPQKPNRRRTPFSHGTAQAQPARLSAFAPLPSAPFLRPPSPLPVREQSLTVGNALAPQIHINQVFEFLQCSQSAPQMRTGNIAFFIVPEYPRLTQGPRSQWLDFLSDSGMKPRPVCEERLRDLPAGVPVLSWGTKDISL